MPESARRIALLGSTGSIGRQALDVVRWHPDRFRVAVLAAGTDSPLLQAQVDEFAPTVVAVGQRLDPTWQPQASRLFVGSAALTQCVTEAEIDLVLAATVGNVGLEPMLTALALGKPVVAANKEALVMAGHLVMAAARQHGGAVIPVDSEHNAVWQCLRGENTAAIRRVTLTASGGPFRDWPLDSLPAVTPDQALQHPTWSMGPKITVDSATLMNKGLEVLEASWLFDLPLDRIDFVLHRESVVHCLVEFADGSVNAQLAVPDMRLPIQYAFSYPERLSTPLPALDLIALSKLSFERVDPRRFRCAFIAIEAGRRGGTYPAVLCAANEVAVQLFFEREIRFTEIADVVERALDAHVPTSSPDLGTILDADRWARTFVERQVLARA